MGVEIIEKDGNYLHFFRSLLVTLEEDSPFHAPQINVELMQQQHKEPMPEKRAGEYDEGRRNLHDKPQPLGGWGKNRKDTTCSWIQKTKRIAIKVLMTCCLNSFQRG